MELREIRSVQMARPFEYFPPFPDEEHTLLICVADETVTDAERARLSAEIVAAKCRYAVCWGLGCSAWDTTIDWAYLETDKDFNPPDNTFIMTSWHDDERIEDAIEFWWLNTSFDDFLPTKFGILVVGAAPELAAKIQRITCDLEHNWNKQGQTRPL